MDKFMEKFNIYDIFTMLIPGIINVSLFSVSFSFIYYEKWNNLGNEKYAFFLILSYLCGVVFQEFGTITDNLFLYKFLYGGKPKEIFLNNKGKNHILNEEIFLNNALYIRDYFIRKLNIAPIHSEGDTSEQEKINSLIFGYCLNTAESNNLSWKAEKMLIISEMSRSILWGCIFTIFLNIYMMINYQTHYKFYVIEIVVLVILAIIFMCRKKRYEKYRIRILLRAIFLYIKADSNQ